MRNQELLTEDDERRAVAVLLALAEDESESGEVRLSAATSVLSCSYPPTEPERAQPDDLELIAQRVAELVQANGKAAA